MRYGALIGDIAGSRFEGVSNDFFSSKPASLLKPEDLWYSTDNTDYDALELRGRFTDDSVLTLACADAVLEHRKTGEMLKRLVIRQFQEKGKAYIHRGFGGQFSNWVYRSNPLPYQSYGNGAAMRVSPCAWLADCYETAMWYSHTVTEVTHNHPDSFWGADAVVTAIWYLNETHDKQAVFELLRRKFGYDVNIVKNSEFQINCRQAVSLALKAVWESESFMEALHKAVCFGGDTDTLAAITGSIAEALYPIPEGLKKQAEVFFDKDHVSEEWEEPVAESAFLAFREWQEPEKAFKGILPEKKGFWQRLRK